MGTSDAHASQGSKGTLTVVTAGDRRDDASRTAVDFPGRLSRRDCTPVNICLFCKQLFAWLLT